MVSSRLRPQVYEWVFRIGFSTIFLINALVAVVQPQSFAGLLQDSIVVKLFGHLPFWLVIIALNDALTGVMILVLGWRYKIIDAWAGVWLLIVTYFKVASLFK